MNQDVAREKETYAKTGVDIGAGNRAVELIKGHVRSTFRPEVLGDIGFFGGLFQLSHYVKPVLVSSTDSVGTKQKIAFALERHDTIGIDLVNHSVNDIFSCGAEPLFFLDYIGIGKLVPEKVEQIVKGLATACREVGCALLGGETAELPGFYSEGEYDLAGFIVGVVEKDRIIDGCDIEAGDVILGLPSSGLHTNGYSLVRKIFAIDQDSSSLKTYYPELGHTLGEELLEPHRCYYPRLKWVLPHLKGMAHITGGGLIDNVPRVLPSGIAARFEIGAWKVPSIFTLIQKLGSVDDSEMYHTFNMGIGMALICSKAKTREVRESLPEALIIGEVVKQVGAERVIFA